MADGRYLVRALDAVVTGAPAPEPRVDDAAQLAVAAFVAADRLDGVAATRLATRALRQLTPDADAVTRVTAYAARAFAASNELEAGGWVDTAPGLTPTGDPIADALPLLDEVGGGAEAEFARYLLAEAALTCARVGLASSLPLPDPEAFLVREGRPHPFSVVLGVLVARIAAFNGRVSEARAALDLPATDVPLSALLLDATRALVLGNAADPVAARSLADRVRREQPSPSDRISAGCWLLASYGLLAIADVEGAAELLIGAGGGADLERLMITDRAIGFETLVNAALADGDPDAAEAWADRAERLAASPIADASVLRTRSRILLARGEAEAARAAALAAGDRARAEGRGIEANEADILAARAEVSAGAGGDAGRRLQRMAQRAAESGHAAAIRAASHELRSTGRRLRPFAGTGWRGLTEREREVGALLLEGLTNPEIAERLYLSPHTVRAHVSRVLAAFGAASRSALAGRIMATGSGAGLAALTARQQQVVAELVTGAGNAEIASRLGISQKTVEKHLHEIMRRVGATTRVGVIRSLSAVG